MLPYIGGLINTLGLYDTVQELTSNTTQVHQSVKTMLMNANIPLSVEVEAALEESFPSSSEIADSFSQKGHLRSEVTHSSQKYKSLFEMNIHEMRTMVSHYLDDYLLFGIPLRETEIELLTKYGNVSLSEAFNQPS
mmetsp:Transcript_26045/g.43919  ORF Transcript_26045/g.43919 Transcript_26045/m.43919 type:complete len:136 (+) Transcript_26045:30-437(+)